MCCGSKRIQLKSSAASRTSEGTRTSSQSHANHENSRLLAGLRPTMGALPTSLRKALTQAARPAPGA